ncbi:MAG: 30S ribosomal protein S12 methylthiotransferase RimO [Fimbriimonas ginsengisoli]|uniref:Ribosomal protein uS12 methylthiotransferase RimO n=1 Tax=Fimbriimonas ginsengisoli TaxID=1005039 RepID=A0A931LU71_FIMGI|nr:30S ribosomal protein S12 methylthiotransferase RimO [Fimbriimonas ginsengisoli]
MPNARRTVRIVTLGCAKNEVDSEEIAGVLSKAGFRLDGAADRVDLTLINTCGFLQAAQAESIAAIRKAVRDRKRGLTSKVVVAGCLAQRLGPRMAVAAPGADAYVGVGQMGRFDAIVRGVFDGRQPAIESGPPHHRWADVQTRARTGTPWSAYLKVSEGCDHACTFCTIPSFRGPHQSKPLERVLDEALFLASTGARELNLIAQDVTQYGYDIYGKFTLPRLLRELNAVEGIDWIRMLYFYPSRLTDEVIDAMASLPNVLPYVDIPLQHVHPDVLRRMRRPGCGDKYLALFGKLRAALPEVAIRTTFIVGFPGETAAEFAYLLDFLREARLDRVGAFQYSREPGTPSHDMAGQTPARVKQDRFHTLMSLQQDISLSINRDWVGKELSVLVDSAENGWSVGRSHRDAPEIDGLVMVAGEARPGQIVPVRITGAEPYDLTGEIVAGGGKRDNLLPLRMSPPRTPR